MIENTGDIMGRVNRVVNKDDTIIVVVETEGGERHVMFNRKVFEDIWKTIRGNLVGRRVRVSGNPPAQRFEFVDVENPRKNKKKKLFRG